MTPILSFTTKMAVNNIVSTSTKVSINKNKPKEKYKITVAPIEIKNNLIVNTLSTQNDTDKVFYSVSQYSSVDDFQQPKNPIKRSCIQSLNSPSFVQNTKVPIFALTNTFQSLSIDDDFSSYPQHLFLHKLYSL